MSLRQTLISIFSGLLLCTVGFAAHTDKLGHVYEAPAHMSNHGLKKLMVGSFSAVSLEGNLDVTIHGRARYAKVSVKTQENLRPSVHLPASARPVVWVSHDVLHINNRGSSQVMHVVLNMPSIKALYADGAVQITSDHLKSRGLVFFDNSSRDIYLNGMLKVNEVATHGSGNVYIRWVDSNVLTLEDSGSGVVRMGGVAKTLRARLLNYAKFDGQFLRANDVMIQTIGGSAAKVFPVYALQAFAYGYSNVFFYHMPLSLNRMTMGSANVLQAGWRL
jgi:hypothetical protein